MISTLANFKKHIDDAMDLIEKDKRFKSEASGSVTELNDFRDTESLLARCEIICDKYHECKPPLRIIHHLGCTGGSLISKCISSLPNVYLLSEVHPYSNLRYIGDIPHFAPQDIISLLQFAGVPQQRKIIDHIFKSSVEAVSEHVASHGGFLVLREHTHTDYHSHLPVPEKNTLISLLENKFQIRSVLTVRNPVDSFLSLKKHGWIRFTPNTFEEYCSRLLKLYEHFSNEQIIHYEDFVANPNKEMEKIAGLLRIPFDDTFIDIFSAFKVTGDSGRSGGIISQRKRRNLSKEELLEFSSSTSYQRIKERYDIRGESIT